MGLPGVDLIPGINVGAAWQQLTGQGDTDIFPDASFTGGVRNPTVQSGNVLGVAYGPQSYATGPGAGNENYNPVAREGVYSGSTVPATYTDPTGRTWNSQAEYQGNVRRNIGVKQGGYEGEGRTTAAGNRLAYNNDSQGFVTGQRTGQNTINSGRVNNALNLRRSMAAIASGLRQGVRSGAVSLANMNALDSGASEAMARAFARQGNQQAGTVNNEAQLAENSFQTQQQNLETERAKGLGQLKDWRQNKINEISTGLWQKLAELDATAQESGVSGAVDMGIRDRVVADASRELDAIDATTQAELAKITGLDYGQVQAQASQMDAAGAELANPFTYEGGGLQVGNGMAGTGNMAGAPIGPIGTGPRYRDDQNTLLPATWQRQDDKQPVLA